MLPSPKPSRETDLAPGYHAFSAPKPATRPQTSPMGATDIAGDGGIVDLRGLVHV